MELAELTREVIGLGKDMAVVKTSIGFLMKSYWLLFGAVATNVVIGGVHFRLAKRNGNGKTKPKC